MTRSDTFTAQLDSLLAWLETENGITASARLGLMDSLSSEHPEHAETLSLLWLGLIKLWNEAHRSA